MILQQRDVPFLEEKCPESTRHANIRARNIMKTDLVLLGLQVKVAELVDVLTQHSYSEFLVVNRDANEQGPFTLIGLISRVDLLALLRCGSVSYANGEAGSEETDKFLSFAELDAARAHISCPQNKK